MTISAAEALTRCIEHREIFHDEMLHLMRMLMRGEMSPQIASALLMGLRVKKNHRRDHRRRAGHARIRHARGHAQSGRPARHVRHGRRRQPHLQHLHHVHVRGRRRRRAHRQARQPQRLLVQRQRRCAGSAGRQPDAVARAGGRMHPGHRHRLHVRARPPRRHEERGRRAQGTGRAHHLQHPGPADQPGRRRQPADGRVPRRPGRHPGARAGAPGLAPCAGGAWQGRHGRGLAGRGHAGGRTQGRQSLGI